MPIQTLPTGGGIWSPIQFQTPTKTKPTSTTILSAPIPPIYTPSTDWTARGAAARKNIALAQAESSLSAASQRAENELRHRRLFATPPPTATTMDEIERALNRATLEASPSAAYQPLSPPSSQLTFEPRESSFLYAPLPKKAALGSGSLDSLCLDPPNNLTARDRLILDTYDWTYRPTHSKPTKYPTPQSAPPKQRHTHEWPSVSGLDESTSDYASGSSDPFASSSLTDSSGNESRPLFTISNRGQRERDANRSRSSRHRHQGTDGPSIQAPPITTQPIRTPQISPLIFPSPAQQQQLPSSNPFLTNPNLISPLTTRTDMSSLLGLTPMHPTYATINNTTTASAGAPSFIAPSNSFVHGGTLAFSDSEASLLSPFTPTSNHSYHQQPQHSSSRVLSASKSQHLNDSLRYRTQLRTEQLEAAASRPQPRLSAIPSSGSGTASDSDQFHSSSTSWSSSANSSSNDSSRSRGTTAADLSQWTMNSEFVSVTQLSD